MISYLQAMWIGVRQLYFTSLLYYWYLWERKETKRQLQGLGIFWTTPAFVQWGKSGWSPRLSTVLEDTQCHPLSSMLPWLTSAAVAHICFGSYTTAWCLFLWMIYPLPLNSILFKYTYVIKKYTKKYKTHFFLQTFSFSSMGSLQDSPFYTRDWLSPTTSEGSLLS